MKQNLEIIKEANTLLTQLVLLLAPYSLDDLKKMLNEFEKGLDALPVYMAFGATREWADTVRAKAEALRALIEIKKKIEKREL
jgi:hypothetical protein